MGMFDTIVFDREIPCEKCGTAVKSTQTKQMGQTLDTYGIGDVVEGCPVLTGVLEETLYCDKCRGLDQKIFVTIWHSLVTGIYSSQAEAERRLLDVDRADILNHLITHQTEERRVRRLLWSVITVVSEYAAYLKAEDKVAFMKEPFAMIRRTELEECLKSEDPLKAIVDRYRSELAAGRGDAGGWW